MRVRASYSVVKLGPESITIRDNYSSDNPTMSVTNDAEAVVDALLKWYGHRRRIFYYDTDGQLDELLHDGRQFTGFAPGPRP